MIIREATHDDFKFIWPIFHSVVSKGETYVYSTETSFEQAYHIWMDRPLKTYIVEFNSEIVGTYYIKPNFSGLGSHICSCGFMVHEEYRNQGIASEMCNHSFDVAKQFGFSAMQFNFVVSSNVASIALWKKMGFSIVGTVPNAYQHSVKGLVDVYIMHRLLD